MIYTVTLNPAFDLIVSLHEPCKNGLINRAFSETIVAGGKGINVARVLKVLKRDSVVLGFVGDVTGKYLEIEIKRLGIKTDFAYINGTTRTNVKLLFDHQKEQTEINAPSPEITHNDVMNFAKKLAKIKNDDVVAFCGSLPKTFSMNIFENCLKLLANNKARLFIDMSGTPLLKSLKYKPLVVKINQEELSDTLYMDNRTEDEVVKGAKRLLKMGAQNVIITNSQGAILVNSHGTIQYKAPKVEVRNSVGAGDSFLAGFIDEYLKNKSFDRALRKGVVVGTATAKSLDLADEKAIKEVNKLMEE